MDAEFVALTHEVTRADGRGREVVVRPARLTLARVSVVRGEGPREGMVLMDSYIVPAEPVVNYLTRYSGLRPGDLDPAVSRHHVTNMKDAYLKLRYLVDAGGPPPPAACAGLSLEVPTPPLRALPRPALPCPACEGCVLVGHGLSKDFEMVNIVVPRKQIVDTVAGRSAPRPTPRRPQGLHASLLPPPLLRAAPCVGGTLLHPW